MGKLEQRKLSQPKGRPKHALDVWKDKKSVSIKRKQRERERVQRIRQLSRQLKNDIASEEQRSRESRKANAERKRENERKSMVVQEIKNTRAVQKLSPKHRRKARIYLKYELNKLR